MSETTLPKSCCEAVTEALATFNESQVTAMNVVFPNTLTGINSFQIIAAESVLIEKDTRAALLNILNNVCKCDCCVGAASAVVQAELNALQQASFQTVNIASTPFSTLLGLSIPNNVVTNPVQPTLNGYVDVTASLAAWQLANPLATPAQIAAQLVLIKAYRSTLQVQIEDVLRAQAAAQVVDVLAAVTCTDSSDTCPPKTCFEGKKCESSSSSSTPAPKPCKPCKKPVKESKVCHKKEGREHRHH